ncbi:hypothetical protein [Parasedimentitalea psychrophila]|uniref:Uncharacterized protein n=1 Tax=Parasedimentitalea psychrophila TaxID=2997337 RepID=A0A9Y2KYH7_9RHOB|nr:hypothetical protein [Parasedimentitalea psychrophila]WIY24863.1 hypothetical protein QPJ95_20565 [Parasedimentitalea psychrophila]
MEALRSTEVGAASLPRMQNRFPYLHPKLVPSLLHDREAFIEHLAKTHQLTLTEAREEVEDFFFIEGLLSEVEG